MDSLQLVLTLLFYGAKHFHEEKFHVVVYMIDWPVNKNGSDVYYPWNVGRSQGGFLLVFHQVIIEAKEFLRTGRGDDISMSEDSTEVYIETPEKPRSRVVALLILQHNDMMNDDAEYRSFSNPELESVDTLEVWDGNATIGTDSSGDSHSDEYNDSNEEKAMNSEDEYDYFENIDQNFNVEQPLHDTQFLRKRWRSCAKAGAKVCKKACIVAYKNACDRHSCKSKLKRTMKKECKKSCKEFFR